MTTTGAVKLAWGENSGHVTHAVKQPIVSEDEINDALARFEKAIEKRVGESS